MSPSAGDPPAPAGGLRWAVLGASTIADEVMIGALGHDDGTVVAVHSRSTERARAVADRHQIERSGSDLDVVLSSADIDAVFVGTTNDRHHAQTLAAITAGKHVLCEKPIAMTVAQAREMVAAAAARGVVLAVNHQQREQATVRRLRQLIGDGGLGPIRAARFAHAGRLREDLRTWRLTDPSAGAGVELDLTVHDADLVRFLLGREVREVMAMTVAEDGARANTSAMAILHLDGGALVSLYESFEAPSAEPAIEIHGEQATAICVGHTAQVAAGRLWLTRAGSSHREAVDVGPPVSPYAGVVQAFTAAVRGHGRPSASGEDGLRSLQIALAVQTAGHTGERIVLT